MTGIEALAWEARRRGISYGMLAVSVTPEETAQIERDYREYLRGETVQTVAPMDGISYIFDGDMGAEDYEFVQRIIARGGNQHDLVGDNYY